MLKLIFIVSALISKTMASSTPLTSKLIGLPERNNNDKKLVIQTEGKNPFLYNCTSNAQCVGGLSDACNFLNGPNADYWFCNCICDSEFVCNQNAECCTNICNNGKCTTSGGTQGTVCDTGNAACASITQCADGYMCKPWGYDGFGYCDYSSIENNPYLYPCSSNDQCSNHLCATMGPNSTYWFCACYCGGGPCQKDEDCCTNTCDKEKEICSPYGGEQGSVCGGNCPYGDECAPGYVCQPWGEFGYCNYVSTSASFTQTKTTNKTESKSENFNLINLLTT